MNQSLWNPPRQLVSQRHFETSCWENCTVQQGLNYRPIRISGPPQKVLDLELLWNRVLLEPQWFRIKCFLRLYCLFLDSFFLDYIAWIPESRLLFDIFPLRTCSEVFCWTVLSCCTLLCNGRYQKLLNIRMSSQHWWKINKRPPSNKRPLE